MPLLAEVRCKGANVLFLLRRLAVSLREDGLPTTWRRIRLRIGPFPSVPHCRNTLYLPAPAPFAIFTLPCDSTPCASIVIPVHNHIEHTVACLRAIATHPPTAGIEVIVVDDGSSDATAQWLPQVIGLRYHRRSDNGGFIAACNDGAALARGKYLVFLNNDTVPQLGWLDALLSTFERQANVGLAGAQLLYPDGRLQEAGGVIFSDGSAWNYGKFQSPFDPRYAYLRDADYCSGAAIAIPRELFASLGGFDTRYAPAYCEDADLAFAVRAAGKRVVYQPAARVVHREGVSSGIDIHHGMKSHQVRNALILAEKWKQSLILQPAAGTLPEPALLHRRQRQVLIVDTQLPTPDRDSGSLRLFNLLRMLGEEGMHICLLPLNSRYDAHHVDELQGLGVETWYPPFQERTSTFLRKQGSRFDTVMLRHYYVASPLLPLLRRYSPRAKLILDTIDLHGLREQRAAELANDRLLLRNAKMTMRAELDTVRRTDLTLVHAEYERDWLRQRLPDAHIEILSNLHDVFATGLPFAHRHDLMFVGNFRHPPNVDGMLWFGEQVFPLLRPLLPGSILHCIGAEPPSAVRALAKHEGIVVHGHVPDLTPYLDGIRVAVAPLRYGAGVKGKINQSMAHGQPVVATSCAVEGMYLQDGEDVLIADTAEAFAHAVARLYQDEALWLQLALGGQKNIARHFSLDAARPVIRRVFGLDQSIHQT